MTSDKRLAPYGTWKSSISADTLSTVLVGLQDVLVDPTTSDIFHVEIRPADAGHRAIVKTELRADVFGNDWNIGSAVHGYGGTAAVLHDGLVYFSNANDSRVYRVRSDGNEAPAPVSPENKNHYFADFTVYPARPELLVGIFEDHTNPAPADVVNHLALIDTTTSTVSPLVSGADFYSSPKFSPDGSMLAWIQWSHPDMPWEGAELYIGNVDIASGELKISNRVKVAGEHTKSSAVQPLWVDKSTLMFTDDISGYRNIYECKILSQDKLTVSVELATSTFIKEDFGFPQWRFGDYCHAALDAEYTIGHAFRDGRSILYLINFVLKTETQLDCPYVQIGYVRHRSAKSIVFLGAKVDEPMEVVLCTIDEDKKPKYTTLKTIAPESTAKFAGLISTPQPISLVVPPNNEPLHVVYYPPTNSNYVGPEDEKPPAIINCHGGPTALTLQGFDLAKHYFTSRGWAFIDVNYGGSACYGRKYIERLAGNWGIVDVQDCIQTVLQLSAPPYNLIDRNRTVVRGGSAGGFLTLSCLCAGPDVFRAGASSYGISDLLKLHQSTHKYQSRYILRLLGGSYEDIPEVYEGRSPKNNVDKIRSPLLILQGSSDFIVPPSQAEIMVDAIRKRNGHVEYIVFEGERHGWARSDTIKTAYTKELEFFMHVLDLKEDST